LNSLGSLGTLTPMPEAFAVCSMCRKPIAMGSKFWRCSVSTCNSGRVKLSFCSVSCWDAHLPTARHRNASAIEEVASAQQKR
jgi:hypothetical protein